MKHIGLFEGIGGFSLAARWMGWETIAWCEWNEFCQKVLSYHFPKAKQHGDITKTDFTIYRGQCDILTGGFPCQPYSQAGKRKGKEDDRHLWPEMLRAIKEIQPRWVVGENVLGLVNWSGGLVFHEVQTDLEAAGYEVWPYVLPACAVNAPHRRDRVWFVAYSNSCRNNRTNGSKEGIRKSKSEIKSGGRRTSEINRLGNEQTSPNTNGYGCDRCDSQNEKHTSYGKFNALNDIEQIIASYPYGARREKLNDATKPNKQEGVSRSDDALYANGTSKQGEHIGQEGKGEFDRSNSGNGINEWENFPTQSPICSGNDGVSYRVDGITFPKWRNESIKAYGNAIVPQVAFQIYKAIEQFNLIKPTQQ